MCKAHSTYTGIFQFHSSRIQNSENKNIVGTHYFFVFDNQFCWMKQSKNLITKANYALKGNVKYLFGEIRAL